MKKTITVFTPTYNREYCLGKCYESLKLQTSKDFLWLIIDDGSSDDTKKLVDSWIAENEIIIKYFYKPNGGMHTAHNLAYDLIDTELNVCIDSDDYMTYDAIEKIVRFWKRHGDESCGGIYALDGTDDKKIIGEKFPDDLKKFKGYGYKEIFYDDGKKHIVKGDKKFISVTKVLKKYPEIPVFEGEKYYSLYHKQHFIERDYNILIMNEVVCIVEYLPDGSSMNMVKQYMTNPQGFADIRKVVMRLAPTFKLRFRESIHYVSTSMILKNKKFLQESPCKIETIIAIPLGIILNVIINEKYKKLNNNSGLE